MPKSKASTNGHLKPDPHNARKHGERNQALIGQSLQEVGPFRSIAVDGDDIIRAGNGVYAKAQAMGFKVRVVEAKPDELIAVKRPDLHGKKAERAALLDNRAGELSEWDDAVIAEIAANEREMLDGLFSDKELVELLGNEAISGEAPDAQIDKAAELQAKWGVTEGDIWQAGRHRLMCADSLVLDNVRRALDGKTPDLVIADPPYGVSIVATNGYVGGGEAYNIPFGGRKGKRLGSANGAKPFGSKSERVRGSDRAAHVVDVGKYLPVEGDDSTDTAKKAVALLLAEYPDAVHVWWGGNYYTDALEPSPCWLVWNKETTGNFADCELAWTNQDKAAKLFTHRWNGMLRDSERERRFHPTQKPSALAAWVFSEFTQPDALILDPFNGAGWAVVGAEQTGRTAVVIEKTTDYIAITLERLQAMGLTPKRL